ncbi:MAG: hypothetical protein AAF628_23985 [Planctomycetota bacterium]
MSAVEAGEPVERFVERERVEGLHFRGVDVRQRRQLAVPAASFHGSRRVGIVGEHLPHRPGRGPKEVFAAFRSGGCVG